MKNECMKYSHVLSISKYNHDIEINSIYDLTQFLREIASDFEEMAQDGLEFDLSDIKTFGTFSVGTSDPEIAEIWEGVGLNPDYDPEAEIRERSSAVCPS